MNATKQRWLDAGTELLSEGGGVAAVRIDVLTERVGLSTGSFYHHFRGASGFKHELLTHLRDRQIDAFAQVVHGDPPVRPRSARQTFADLIARLATARGDLRRPRLEAALRAWALTDPDAAQTQAAIDAGRLESIRSVWRQVTEDEEELQLAALLPYVIAIGSNTIMPPLGNDDLQRLYERIFPLIPDDLATGTDSRRGA